MPSHPTDARAAPMVGPARGWAVNPVMARVWTRALIVVLTAASIGLLAADLGRLWLFDPLSWTMHDGPSPVVWFLGSTGYVAALMLPAAATSTRMLVRWAFGLAACALALATIAYSLMRVGFTVAEHGGIVGMRPPWFPLNVVGWWGPVEAAVLCATAWWVTWGIKKDARTYWRVLERCFAGLLAVAGVLRYPRSLMRALAAATVAACCGWVAEVVASSMGDLSPVLGDTHLRALVFALWTASAAGYCLVDDPRAATLRRRLGLVIAATALGSALAAAAYYPSLAGGLYDLVGPDGKHELDGAVLMSTLIPLAASIPALVGVGVIALMPRRRVPWSHRVRRQTA